ncbi:VOC family protein [Halomarina halobia]|uniref:VOC family protein n=1 Tax=Halomarina halobia TaxID=3033386 RepID=A0ABD6AEX8_9EURY|nr:VOC family protein [Halomarina sp. PSR21]
MDVIGVDRVIIATENIDATRSQFEALLGLSFGDLLEPTTNTDAGDENVANVLSASGIELVTPREDSAEVARFLEENGPGLYAVSIRVHDLDGAIEELSRKGVDPVGEYEANDFAEVFYHPQHFGGAFVILAEYDAPHPAETASL